MNTWEKRRRAIEATTDFDPLTTIPMLEIGADFSDLMTKRIRTEFDRHTAMNVVIIDPYFEPLQMETIVSLFASLQGRTVTIITNLDSVNNPDDKKKIAAKLSQIKKTVVEKGIFKKLIIYKTDIGIHDRVIYSPDDGCSSLFFCLGASLNMLFKKHSYIIRVSNEVFKNAMIKLVETCKANGYEV